MTEQWHKLEKWFSARYPKMVADLNSGCDSAEILDLEREIGIRLPEKFKEFYLIHNGQKAVDYIGIFYNLSLLSLSKIRTEMELWAGIIDEYGEEQMKINFDQYQSSLMPDKVKAMYANKKWVPFAVIWDSNYLGLDFDPEPDGSFGQVINFGREEEQKAVLAESFESFIDLYISELEAGNFFLKADGDQMLFIPKKYKRRITEGGSRLPGYVAKRFIEEPSIEDQIRLGINL